MIRLPDAPPVSATIEAIASAAEESAASDLASAWTADAARVLGGGRDRLAMLRLLADRLSSSVTFRPDEYGSENVQTLDETIRDRAGDCDDFAVSMLALGRRAGLRGALLVYERETPEGPVAVHVLPAFSHPDRPGEWVPVETSKPGVPFGSLPPMGPGSGAWSAPIPVQAESPFDGVGFLPALAAAAVGAAGSIFAAKAGADASKDAARSAERSAENQARATAQAVAAEASASERNEERRTQRVREILAFANRALPFVVGLAAFSLVVKLLR